MLMQLVGQPAAGRIVTLKVAVLVLPHWSVAVTLTGVVPRGKQVVSGGLKVKVAPELGQHLSTAKVLKGTLVQLPQV